jgi:hypothetical protein
MRSPITTLIQQYSSLSDVEQKVFLDMIDPQPEPQPVKRARAKRGTGAKSKRAAGMAEAIKSSLEAQQPLIENEDVQAQEDGPLCGACGHGADYQDHFKPSPQYHEFDGPKSVARAPRKSRQKKEEPGSTPNSEIETETALSAGAGD